MKEIFTNRAKTALQNAQNEAKLLRHRTVGTEHLLLGLITGAGWYCRENITRGLINSGKCSR